MNLNRCFLRLMCQSVLSSAALIAGGCGGDGGSLATAGLGNGEFTGGSQTLGEFRDQLTHDEAYHLLRRAAFGATPQQVDQAVRQGLRATVDELLRIRPVPSSISALEETYGEDIPKRWMVHLIESPNPLYEKMALFWHDRFATSRRVANGRDRGLPLVHWQMVRTHALGNYRTFLQELTVDPLMLIWLDGANSQKHSPNENYAREFWELFTLGRDVLYTEADIKEAARAFTGIVLLREQDENARPAFDLHHHDDTMKMIFPGRKEAGNYDYITMIDLTIEQPEAADYVARNLFELFVHDHPSDATRRDLSDFFRRSNYEIAPLVRRILTSQAMFSADAIGNRVLSPVEHIVGVARTLDMHIHSEDSQGHQIDRLVRDLRAAGQELLNPPGVEGWGRNEYWTQGQWLINRAHALSRWMEFGPNRSSEGPMHLLPPPGQAWQQREIREMVVATFESVFHLKLTEEERAIYMEVLDQNGWRALHLEEPDRQLTHVFELIRLMAMHEMVIGS
jgi:uncharacterized protein (DUF1800 family)